MVKIKHKVRAVEIFFKEFVNRFQFYFNKKKLVGYIGGHGVKNLGDDVMYYALEKSVLPYKVVTFQTIGVEKLLSAFGLSGKKFFKLLVLGGGTLINDMWRNKVGRSLQFGIPLISLGTGVGSCGVEQSETVDFSSWKDILNKFESVNVRGYLSKTRLESIDVPSTVTGDLALLLATGQLKNTYSKKIGLNLMDIPLYNQFWEAIIPILIDLQAEGWQYEALVINPKDLIYTRSYFEKLGLKQHSIKLINSYEGFIQASENLAFTICVRLHGSVLSLCANVPTILFGYRDKCEDFMSSIDLADFYVNLNLLDKDFKIADKISTLKQADQQIAIREKIFNNTNEYKSRLFQVIKAKVFGN